MSKRKISSAVEPRKEPKQERSKQTFQDILRGAKYVIRRDGIQKLSTNKVAEESGVSIGSLYQYFPSKEAIIAALIEQYIEEEYNRLRDKLGVVSPKLGARSIIRNIFSPFYEGEKSDLVLKRSLINFVPIVDKTAEAIRFHRAVAELIITFFSSHYQVPTSERDHETVIYLLQYVMRGLLLGSTGEGLEKLDLNTLLDEIAEAILNVLKVPADFRDAH